MHIIKESLPYRYSQAAEEEMVLVLKMNEGVETTTALDHCFSSTACDDSKPGRTFSDA